MKKLLLILLVVASVASLFGRGGHGGYRGGHGWGGRSYSGYGRHGWGGRGWGYGPAIGIGLGGYYGWGYDDPFVAAPLEVIEDDGEYVVEE